MFPNIAALTAEVERIRTCYRTGHLEAVQGQTVRVSGLSDVAAIGDRVSLHPRAAPAIFGEVIQFSGEDLLVFADAPPTGLRTQDPVRHVGPVTLAPGDHWIGRIIDPYGQPLDGRPLMGGVEARSLMSPPPPAADRGAMGQALNTGYAAFNTVLPIVEGQRLGLFAGSGVGKSNLLAGLAAAMEADVVVIAMIGERGRELRSFVDEALGASARQRAVVVAATSDQSPLARRRSALSAMTVAEYFRDQGKSVLFLADSITRLAEAHREIASAGGELPSLRGHPASVAHLIMSLCERAGPGLIGGGMITALFTVLVAGSDMEEPVSDILRGTLDGHIVLSRDIAERGRYPAIDLLRSVSRSLPGAVSPDQNALIGEARKLLGLYEANETMIRAGLYTQGSDPDLDRAIRLWPELDRFLADKSPGGIRDSFSRLALILRRSETAAR